MPVRSLLRLLTALALGLSGLVLAGSPASACSCTAGDVGRQAEAADVVFSGVLVEQTTVRRQDTFTFEAERVYGGSLDDSRVDVVSASERSLCGLGRLQTDQAYVVFASGERLATATCSGTGRATAAYVADVERVLGRGNPVPQPSAPEPQPPAPEFTRVAEGEAPPFLRTAAPGGAMVLVGLLGLVLFRKRS